jgi:hypothetical protein
VDKELECRIREQNEDALVIPGHDDAIIGMGSRCCQHIVVAYDTEKIVKGLMSRDGMSYDEAMEYFDHNIGCAYVGEDTPVYIDVFNTSKEPDGKHRKQHPAKGQTPIPSRRKR